MHIPMNPIADSGEICDRILAEYASQKLLIKIHTNLLSFKQLEALFLKKLFDLYEKITGVDRSKHEIKLFIEYDNSISPNDLIKVTIRYSQQIKGLTFFKYKRLDDDLLTKTLRNCPFLKFLRLNIETSITSKGLAHLNNLPFLKKIELECCNGIKRFLSLSNCPALEHLSIMRCKGLLELDIHNMLNLKSLELEGCEKIRKIKLSKTKRIQHFSARACYELRELVGIDKLNTLQSINLIHCHDLRKIKIKNLHELEILHIEGFPCLEELKLKNLNKLWKAKIAGCNVEKLLLTDLPSLKYLKIKKCLHVERINFRNLQNLQQLSFEFCNHLQKLWGINRLVSLKELEFYKCASLSKLELKNFPNLERLFISLCKKLSLLKFLNAPKLRLLKIKICPKITKIYGIKKLSQLEEIKLEKNKSLKEIKFDNPKQLENLTILFKKNAQ